MKENPPCNPDACKVYFNPENRTLRASSQLSDRGNPNADVRGTLTVFRGANHCGARRPRSGRCQLTTARAPGREPDEKRSGRTGSAEAQCTLRLRIPVRPPLRVPRHTERQSRANGQCHNHPVRFSGRDGAHRSCVGRTLPFSYERKGAVARTEPQPV